MSQGGSWFSKNSFWAVPLGCLGATVFCCGGGIGTVLLVVLGVMKSAAPYTDSLAAAKASPVVQRELGTPIKAGFAVTGSVNLKNNAGNADLSYTISGPRDSGTVYVEATKSGGTWTYQRAVVVPDDRTPAEIPLNLP
jgi:hypothetical protein